MYLLVNITTYHHCVYRTIPSILDEIRRLLQRRDSLLSYLPHNLSSWLRPFNQPHACSTVYVSS
jgi:hypothetical protein